MKKSFASDNNSGVHPAILQAMQDANHGHVPAYGDDPFTERAVSAIQKQFGETARPFFVFAGTGANVIALKQITQSYHSIICAETAHIHCDECGAPENYAGCKILTIPAPNGKIDPDGIRTHLKGFDFQHHAQPKVISITQSTEYGTVYTIEEMKAIAKLAKDHNLLFHVDGARLGNAAVALNCGLADIAAKAGVDVLSFGGTKNGLMVGECVIFFRPELADNFQYIRKQGMQLFSKMRFISAQYEAYLDKELWKSNAENANRAARLLAERLRESPEIQITQKVEANSVFAIIPKHCIPKIQREYFFYVWNEALSEVRWMTSFDTTEEEVEEFARVIRRAVQ